MHYRELEVNVCMYVCARVCVCVYVYEHVPNRSGGQSTHAEQGRNELKKNLILFRISCVQILPTQTNRRTAFGGFVPRKGSCHCGGCRIDHVRITANNTATTNDATVVVDAVTVRRRLSSTHHHAAGLLLHTATGTTTAGRLSLLHLRSDEVLQQVTRLGRHFLALVSGRGGRNGHSRRRTISNHTTGRRVAAYDCGATADTATVVGIVDVTAGYHHATTAGTLGRCRY